MTNRRQFFQKMTAPAAVAAGFPMIVKASVLGLNGTVAPSNRVTMATLGVGGMGTGHIKEFGKVPEARIIAVCDVDEDKLSAAKAYVDKIYGNQDCATYHAFEEALARTDIDAVSVTLPDHWHGIAAVCAARAGKDIYGEKPLAHNFAEGLVICQTVRKYGRTWQTGSWQRSRENFRRACELVRNGRIGKVRRVEVGLPSGPFSYGKLADKIAPATPPKGFQFDRWLGPAPEAPYCEARCHFNWRWNLDYGGGQLMDWIGHHGDIAHWGLGYDSTGPVEVEGQGEYPARTELWNTAQRYRITAKYADGVVMTIAGGYPEIRDGTRWIGDEGWIYVNRGNKLEAEPAGLLTSEIKPDEIQLPKSPGHYQQFIDCVKSRAATLTPADVALRSATPGWLGQIAMLTGRKIYWDPVNMRILNDPEAAKLLSRDMRLPWRL